MKFLNGIIDIDRMLKLTPEQVMTFVVYPVEPVVIKEHYIKEDNKMFAKPCKEEGCELCITFNTLYRSNMIQEARAFTPFKKYHLPINVDKNPYDFEPGEYVYKFGNQIHVAYMQLLINDKMYKFNVEKKLTFTHKVEKVNGYNSYGSCFFEYGKNTKTVESLCRDASSRRFV